MRVYGWTGWRNACPPAANGSRQTREIMTFRFLSEVMRASGKSRSTLNNYGGETGNPEEIVLANAHPGQVIWRPLDYRGPGGWTIEEKE